MNQSPEPHQAPKSRGMPVALTVVLLAIAALVVVVGVMTALVIYGTRKRTKAVRTAEAHNSLGQLAKDAALAYERDHKICPSASRPVPPVASRVSAMKYQSVAADWEVDKASDAGFYCLRFSMTTPQHYQYDYKATATGFTVTARGDLDGDGVFSEFRLDGTLVGGTLKVAPWFKEQDPDE